MGTFHRKKRGESPSVPTAVGRDSRAAVGVKNLNKQHRRKSRVMDDGFDGFSDTEYFFGTNDEILEKPAAMNVPLSSAAVEEDEVILVDDDGGGRDPLPGDETPSDGTSVEDNHPQNKDEGNGNDDDTEEMTEEDKKKARRLAEEKTSLIGDSARAAASILLRWGKPDEVRSYRSLMRCVGLLDVAIGCLGGGFDEVPKALVSASKKTIQGAVERLGHMSPYDKESIWEDTTLIIAALCDVFVYAKVGDAPNELAEAWDNDLRARIMSTSTTRDDLMSVISLIKFLDDEKDG